MSERPSNPLHADIAAINKFAKVIPTAENAAKRLEQQAAKLRTDSKEDYYQSFERAGNRLAELAVSGCLSPSEIVRAIADLDNLDPELTSMYGEGYADQIVTAFDALQPNEPVIGLSRKDPYQRVTGIILQAPSNVQVHTRKKSRNRMVIQDFMAPWATTEIPILTLNQDGTREEIMAMTEISSLRNAIIGRQALISAVKGTKFEVGTDNTACHPGIVTNAYDLRDLRQKIEQLQKLGMKKINTSKLDKELEAGDSYNQFRNNISHDRSSRATQIRRRKRIIN
jgi:hypothetical protein